MAPISSVSQYSLLKAFVVAKCGHKFHKKCIAKVESEEGGETRLKYVTACSKCSVLEFS
jgi:hypothetical protein